MMVLDKMKFSITDLQNAFGVVPLTSISRYDKSTLDEGDVGFNSVSTDSRSIRKGDLFFALSGSNYDGHDFVSQALAKGASGIVVSKDIDNEHSVVFKVPDTLIALGKLAEYYRRKYDIKCIAVTGSNGKTTTREMLATCLQTRYNTLKTNGNYNNRIGLPLTLFNLEKTHQVGVFELGISEAGEMSELARICQPQVGVFTNIAPVHLENMGTVETVAKEKFELTRALPSDGTVVLNIDDNYLKEWINSVSCKIVTYGIDYDADFKAQSLNDTAGKYSTFEINNVNFRLNFPGKHNIYNATAAVAAASVLGCSLQDLVEPLSKVKAYNLRSEIFENNKIVFIDDCYNANPISMKKAIDVLAQYPSSGRKVAVLGDMFELGNSQEKFHREIGKYLNSAGIDALFAFGELSYLYLEKFKSKDKEHFENKNKLIRRLEKFLRSGDIVLVKGSRGVALEKVTEFFKRQE